eukprot:CAMPEP_0168364786 /NCGR_PEP_ID=MMETSP0228-20121227/4385_1 /TAXON_ID=133427 /ORGANISM="Protoceratium reticulatum, Strain CCCM 535 (=CCMP 1889)" /LENGTH=196 /DNA_ID=CAMNT_0008377553 /DNA_START=112 /DNA_END=702 /DNA_ORIENTATION=+
MVNFSAVNAAIRGKKDIQKEDSAATIERAQAAKQARESEDRILNGLIKENDKNFSGQLEFEQLRRLLEEESQTQIYDDEVEYYLKRFDSHGGGGINKNDLEPMLRSFRVYMKFKAKADKLFEKYRKGGKMCLEPPELTAMMTELNHGHHVTEDEVKYVLRQADLLGDGNIWRPEIVRAHAMWCNRVKHKNPACCVL